MRTGSQTTGLFTLSRNQGNWHNYMQGARLGCGKRQRECKVRGDWKIENRRLEKWEPSRGRWEVRATLRCPKSTANSQHLSTEHTHPSTQQTLTECPSTQRPQQARVPTHTELSLPGETGKRELSDTDMCCEEKVGRVPGAAGCFGGRSGQATGGLGDGQGLGQCLRVSHQYQIPTSTSFYSLRGEC